MNRTSVRSVAFTLIEVLVVLGIIAVLLSLLFPVISSLRAAAARTACASNLRQISTVVVAYATDNRGQLPAVYGGPEGGPRRRSAFVNAVVNDRGGVKLLVEPPVGIASQPYLRSARIFICEAWLDESVYERWAGNPDEFAYDPGWGPRPADDDHRVISYVYCYVPPGGDWYQRETWVGGSDPHWVKGRFAGLERHSLSQRRAASTTLMFELPLSVRPGFPHEPQHHGHLGHVLYLDGHVTTADARDLHRHVNTYGTPAYAPADPAWGEDTKVLLRALDQGVGAR